MPRQKRTETITQILPATEQRPALRLTVFVETLPREKKRKPSPPPVAKPGYRFMGSKPQ